MHRNGVWVLGRLRPRASHFNARFLSNRVHGSYPNTWEHLLSRHVIFDSNYPIAARCITDNVFESCHFIGLSLTRHVFIRSTLITCYVAHAACQYTVFIDCVFDRVTWCQTNLCHATFIRPTFQSVQFMSFALQHTDFRQVTGCNLSFLDCRVPIARCIPLIPYLSDACITSLSWARCQLSGVDFGGRQLAGINFNGATLRGARFTHSVLIGANFEKADLSESDFTHSTLQFARFNEATMTHANLTHAVFSYALFLGANSGMWFLAIQCKFDKMDQHPMG